MRHSLFLGSIFLVAAVCLPASDADEAAVKKMINEYANAFNSKQLDTVMGYWTEGGVHVDRETGERTEGRDEIRKDIAEAFERSPGTKMLGRIGRLRFVKPDVVIVEGSVTLSGSGLPPSDTEFSAVLVSSGDKWMIDKIEESPVVPPASAADALADLEWLVGKWVDRSDSGQVDTLFRWTANRAFLYRSYAVQSADGEVSREGTQVIGWDPRSGEIRSWSFNSDGSFGDGVWSKNGQDWLVKTTQTLADGRAASGTFVYTRVSDDEMSVRLIGHEVEGEPRPATPEVSIVRVADESTAAAESDEQ